MSTENLSADTGETGGSDLVTFTPEEDAFFASGGESTISEDPPGGKTPETPAPAGADAGKPKNGEVIPPADKAPQNVPLAALHEERHKRKALGGEVETLKTQLAETNGKLAILLKLKGGDAAAEDQPAGPPSAEDDIFGKVKHTDETVAQLQKRLDDADKATKEAGEQTAFVNNYRGDAAAFEAKNPDYKAAYNHLLGSRANELIAIGYDNPAVLRANGADIETVQAAEKALHDALVADEIAIAQLAFSKKKSPAEIIYGLAAQRGYAKKGAAAPGGDTKPKGEEQLDRIEKGQQTNKSLSDTGGGGGSDEMSAERLGAMSLAEFEAYSAKHPARVRALMGG